MESLMGVENFASVAGAAPALHRTRLCEASSAVGIRPTEIIVRRRQTLTTVQVHHSLSMRQESDAMNATNTAREAFGGARGAFELRFRSLFNDGRALAFDCDAQGRIDLDRLTERARERYLYARALIGRDFAQPEVLPL
jgi:hypothetical protein